MKVASFVAWRLHLRRVADYRDGGRLVTFGAVSVVTDRSSGCADPLMSCPGRLGAGLHIGAQERSNVSTWQHWTTGQGMNHEKEEA